MYLSLSLSLYFSLTFFGQVISPHHSDQMSQRTQVSRIALWRCSLNVFVIVFVFVFFIVIVCFGQVMCPHHPDQMSQGSQVSEVTLLLCFFKRSLTRSLTQWVSDKVTYWAVGWTAKNLQRQKSAKKWNTKTQEHKMNFTGRRMQVTNMSSTHLYLLIKPQRHAAISTQTWNRPKFYQQ